MLGKCRDRDLGRGILEKLIPLPPSLKKEESSAQGSREESRGFTIQLFSGTMLGNLSLQRRVEQEDCLGAVSILSATIVGTTII